MRGPEDSDSGSGSGSDLTVRHVTAGYATRAVLNDVSVVARAGEITGLIGSGLFVRFGVVFEAFLPARRLHGEFFALNDTGTALAGRTTGRTYRLGDEIEVRVEQISRHEGKIELALGSS